MKPTVVMWLSETEAAVYRAAVERAGLGGRVEMHEARPGA